MVSSSSKFDNFPRSEDIEVVGKRTKKTPFIFMRPIQIDESSHNSNWSNLQDNDYYPTLNIQIGSETWNKEKIRNEGVQLEADMDTGCSYIFIDYNKLRGILSNPHPNEIVSRPIIRLFTLQEVMSEFFIRNIKIYVCDETGYNAIKTFLSQIITNWEESGMHDINPNRDILIGRNVLIEFPLKIELNGRKRTSKIISIDKKPSK